MAKPVENELLKDLNDAQKQAVSHTEGPVMILAGAGSGKTRVLTHRLAYILQQRLASPWELLALTFTNKAAREMRARIEDLAGNAARDLQMGTFHSIFARILRRESTKIGYASDFSIYDTEDSLSLIKTILKELNLSDKKYRPRGVLSHISGAKNYLISPRQYEAKYSNDEFSGHVAKIYAIYQSRCHQANAMDFDDLLVNMVVLFETSLETLHKYQHKYKYIMVDEYQDTNHAQYVILRKLSIERQNICVVGDDAQSIYGFRGADIQNILGFQKDYPDARVFKLEQNYRSTDVIVNAANEVIEHNEQQIKKNVFTQISGGELIRLLEGGNEGEEAQKIVDAIREQKAVNSYMNGDFAILYRTNAQSRVLEDQLRRAGLPYRIFGGMSFYKRKEVKDVLAYLRLAVNPTDEEAMRRVINYPARGIGATTWDRMAAAARDAETSLWAVAQRARDAGLGRSAAAVEKFANMIKDFQRVVESQGAYGAVDYIAKHSGILKDLHKDNNAENLSRWENVQELINAAKEFEGDEGREDRSLGAFLSEVALYTDQDESDEQTDYITLMTIHAAKGLEFKSVFVSGLEEGLFPSSMSMGSRQEIEEERRLFYVAVTRAKERLSLSYARMRMRFGTPEAGEPSRFLDEIDRKYFKSETLRRNERERTQRPPERLNLTRLTPLNKIDDKAQTPQFAGDDLSGLEAGMKVEHNKFGVGVVAEIDGAGGGRRAVVNFKSKGKKTLILKYAKLKILD